jgi:NADPH-dependent ferric siderophore reductase
VSAADGTAGPTTRSGRDGGRRAGRADRPAIDLEVRRTERLTPRMVRVVLGGPGLAAYHHNTSTDRYVKLVFPVAGADRPRIRTYTVRRFDEAAGELWIDVVQHGDEGIAGPWAGAARPGDPISLRGPGGGYAPDPAAPWHLFVGDPAAFPAIASALEKLPDDAVVHAVLRAHDEAEAAYLDLPPGSRVRWLIGDRPGDDEVSLLDAVRALDLPDGDGQAFVHGELHEVRAMRSYLLDDRRIAPERLSLSGYWRHGLDEEGFQQEKRGTGG